MAAGRFFMERFEDRNHILHDMKLLYPTESSVDKTMQYYKGKKSLFLRVILGGIAVAVLVELTSFLVPLIENTNQIKRKDYGQGDQVVNLKAYYEEGAKTEEIQLVVSEQQYDAKTIERMFSEVLELLPKIVLLENESFDEVRGNLNPVKRIEGYPFEIKWQFDNYRILNRNGVIQGDELTEAGIYTEITATLTYEDYVAESTYGLRLYPPIRTTEEELREQIQNEVLQMEHKNLTQSTVLLPEVIAGQKMIWREKKEYKSLILLALFIIAAAGIYYGRDTELHKLVEARRREMEVDYAEIISKLALFLGAGMTTKGAWKKITEDYQVIYEDNGRKRYAYEEMVITHNEMCSGVSEVKAYERFGARSDLPKYQMLASILSQGVKRGTQSTIELLMHEMQTAFEGRKNMAKQLGEEAGTKLLIPMFMMLMIVMVIIILPAFLSIQGIS